MNGREPPTLRFVFPLGAALVLSTCTCSGPMHGKETPATRPPQVESPRVPGPTGEARVTQVKVVPSFETAGVYLTLDADPVSAATSARIRAEGAPRFEPVHPFVRYDARHVATSLFDLRPSTRYTLEILDGKRVLRHTFSTRPPFIVPRPRRTVRVANRPHLTRALRRARPGDLILVAPGSYTGGFKLENKHGTVRRPIVIRGDVSADALARPVKDRAGLPVIRDAHVNPVDGMEIGLYISASSHIVVDSLRFEKNPRSAIRLDGSRFCVVQNCQSINNGGGTQAAMLIYTGGRKAGHNLVQSSYFYEDVRRSGMAEYGVANDLDPGPGTVIRSNTFVGFENAVTPCSDEGKTQDVSENAKDVLARWSNHDVEVYDNTFINVNGDAIEADGICVNARIYRNRVLGRVKYSPISIAPTVPGPVFLVRNIIVGAFRGSSVKFNTSKGRGTIRNIFFYHNTIMRTRKAGTDWGALSFWDGTPSKNIVFKNNIITSVDLLSTIQPEWTHRPAMDHNLWYASRGVEAPVFSYDGNPGFTVGWRGWREKTGYEAHGVWGDPRLDGTLRPRRGSPAIDRGAIIPGVNNGYSGAAPDIGAMEANR